MVEQKCWGTTEELQRTDVMSLHRCEVVAGGYCSMHYHTYRDNVFIVETAKIAVVELCSDHRFYKVLPPRSSYIVKAHVPHRFIVLESGLLWEVYWPNNPACPLDVNDIVRYDTGGTGLSLEEIEALDRQINTTREKR